MTKNEIALADLLNVFIFLLITYFLVYIIKVENFQHHTKKV